MGSRTELLKKGGSRPTRAWTEFEAKQFLKAYGIPVTREKTAASLEAALAAAETIGYPVALKGSGEDLLHKTELGLVKLNLKNSDELSLAYTKLTTAASAPLPEVLIQQMVPGDRELVAGLIRDQQFGPIVMFGLGGIFTEVLDDVSFRVAPLSRWDVLRMVEELRGRKLLDAFRGKPLVDRKALADLLIALGTIGLEHPEIREIDINPLKIQSDGRPIAVDALVILEK